MRPSCVVPILGPGPRAAEQAHRARCWHGAVDTQARGRAHRALVQRQVQPDANLAHPGQPWGSRCKSPSAGPSSVTKMPCRPGSARPLACAQKSPARRATDRLCRRIGSERATHTGAHLGAQGADADHPVPLQLDAHLRHSRTQPNELPCSGCTRDRSRRSST